jgi:uncharacterized protein (DUF58 family)
MKERDNLIRKLARIELRTKILVEGLQFGPHHSLFKGLGLEFADIREYVPGDDIRSIDWKVTARFDRPFVKEFTEERDQTFYLLIDVSGSESFGSEVTKQQKILEVFASLAFAALRNNDRIGLCLFSDRVEKFMPARRGKKHLLAAIDTLILHHPVSQRTDLSAALRFIFRILSRRSTIVILSDFASPEIFPTLAILRRRHEVIAIRVTDRRELSLPDIGCIVLEDPETGEQVVADTSDEAFRDRYAALVREQENQVSSGLSRAGIGNVLLTTDEPYEIPLRRFFRGMKTGRL